MHYEKINIKTVAKNLSIAVQSYGVENISHSASLNMASRVLGIKDYNTFKSIDREITVFNENEKEKEPNKELSKDFNFLKKYEISNVLAQEEKRIQECYPEYDNGMVPFAIIDDNTHAFIDREINNDDTYNYFLSFCISDTTTNRIFYSPKYKTISFYVYPDVKDAIHDYHIELKFSSDKLANKTNILEVLEHVSGKNWFNMDFLHDYFKFCRFLEVNIEMLNTFYKKYPQKKLEKLYLLNHKEE